MRKYRRQGDEMIKSLEEKIKNINLASMIIEARLEKGIDRIPAGILTVIDEIEKLDHLDAPSKYLVLVSHRAPGAIWEPLEQK